MRRISKDDGHDMSPGPSSDAHGQPAGARGRSDRRDQRLRRWRPGRRYDPRETPRRQRRVNSISIKTNPHETNKKRNLIWNERLLASQHATT